MSPQETFVTRLRRHRERNGVSIQEIAEDTRVKPELLEALENNDLSGWPRGLYARAWIRGYAAAAGLDPVDTVDEFCRLFPQGDRRASGTIREIAQIVASPAEYADEISHNDRRRRSAAPAVVIPSSIWHMPVIEAGRMLLQRMTGSRTLPSLRLRRNPGPSL
jgi:transcriptional regulator with XRE-family HTH domain